jgi:hypothetical protein
MGMLRAVRAQKIEKLQKQIAAMHPLALELISGEFTATDRRKFLEGVPFWMMFELSDALAKLCADDRRALKAKGRSSPAR